MVKPKHLFVIFVFMALMLVSFSKLGACSPDDTSRDTVIRAYQNVHKLNNFHMTFNMAISVKSINFSLNSECDYQAKPALVMKQLLTINMGPQTAMKVLQYGEKSGNQLIYYSKINDQWIKQAVPFNNPASEFDNYIKSIKSATLIRETADTKVYEVTIDANSLKEEFEHTFAAMGLQNNADFADAFNNIGDCKTIVYVNKNTSLISEASMDATDIVRTIVNNVVATMNIPDDRKDNIRNMLNDLNVAVKVDYSQMNAVGNIQIPQEAKDAVWFTPGQLQYSMV